MNTRRFLPSPSMGVALLALAIALGGTAYAANKIGSNQIKKNAITTSKIKKKAVTTAKINAKAVTNGKLAKDAVKTGKIADDAVNSSKISDYSTMKNGTAITATDGTPESVARSLAPGTTLLTRGLLRVYAKCFRDTATDTLYGEMYVSTAEDFSIMEGTDDLSGGALTGDYLNTDTPETDRQLDTQTVVGPGTSYQEQEGMMAAPDGPAVSMVTGIGVKNGAVAANGPYGPGNACIFQGGAFG